MIFFGEYKYEYILILFLEEYIPVYQKWANGNTNMNISTTPIQKKKISSLIETLKVWTLLYLVYNNFFFKYKTMIRHKFLFTNTNMNKFSLTKRANTNTNIFGLTKRTVTNS